MRIFFRVGNIETNAGLWYDMGGNFTGLIHDRYTFCKNSTLPMPFDSNIQGYLSAVETLEDIWAWFTPEDVDRLTEYGYRILEYRSDDYKFYNGHWLINQHTSVMQRIFPVNDNISHPGDSMPCTISDWSCEYHACMSDDCQRDHVLMSGHDWGSGACKIADMNDYRNMSDQTLS